MTLAMTWLDELAKIWEFGDGNFGTVKSFRLIEKAEFPASIDPSDLDRSPIALTVPASMKPEYSSGGPLIVYWTGVTEFHVAPDIDFGRIPALMPWYGMILNAATSHMKLNGTVELFLLADSENAIEGPMGLKYGNEAEHWGFTVQWQVKQRIEGMITVNA
jgi:hypothetical protein